MEAKDIIFSGGINTDDEARLIPNGDFRMSKYTRSGSAESQNQGAMESMPGNLLHNNPDLPEGTNTVIGSARWIEGSSIVYMVHNSNGDHTIWSYNINNSSITLVLGNWLYGNGGTALNFQLSNKIYHTNIVDNLLYWTDGYFESFEYNVDGILQFNPPRKIDINKAIKYMASFGSDPEGYNVNSFSTIDESFYTMDAAKHPPLFSPTCAYFNNTDISFNKLRGNQYQFRYQYIFDNNEESKWSPITKLPLPVYDEFLGGADTVNPTRDNSINIELETGPHLVKKIRVAYRIGENGVWGAFVEMDKKDLGLIDPDNQTYTIIFNGNTQIKPATNTEYNFDSIPQIAKCQDVLSNNSIVYGNYYTDYDLLNNIDMEIERVITAETGFNQYRLTNVAGQIISLYDDAGSDNRSVFGYSTVWEIGPDGYPAQNPYGTYIDFRPYLTLPFEEGDVLSFALFELNDDATSYTIYYEITTADLVSFADFQQNFCDYINGTYPGLGYAQRLYVTPIYAPYTAQYIIYIDNALAGPLQGDGYGYWVNRIYFYKRNKVKKSLKTGSKKVFGIQYYDRANRSGSVQYKASNIIQAELDVPFPSQETSPNIKLSPYNQSIKPYTVSAKLTINHYPPDWATHYQILVKKDETILNFQQRGFQKIESDPESYTAARIKISLEDYYTKTYKGATINHTPQKGDIVRFIRRYTLPSGSHGVTSESITYLIDYSLAELRYAYCKQYLELEVLEFLPGGGNNGADAIIVNNFDWQTVLGGAANEYGGLLEIYTIKKEQEDDIWFEIGNEFTIENPHTENRYHNGNTQNQDATDPAIIAIDYGDVYCRKRDMGKGVGNYSFQDTNHIIYWIEDPNYSDFYNSDSHGRGRFGVDDVNAKRRHLKSSVIHSLPLVQNSNINGLSAFQGLSSSLYLDDTFGSINRLKQVGYTLKALQDRKETAIYIQKSYATSGDGSGQLAFTNEVFGGVNPYDTLFGTVHPGSVQLIEGDLYYFDYYTGAFIRTSNNGQDDISSGKYKFNYYTSTKANDIALDFNKYDVLSMIDEQNMEYTCFFNSQVTVTIDSAFVTADGEPLSVNTTEYDLVDLLYAGIVITIVSPSLPPNTNNGDWVVTSVSDLGNGNYQIYVDGELVKDPDHNMSFSFLKDTNEGVVFSYLRDRWITMIDYYPMWAETLGIINVSWDRNGQVYSHNDGTELNFYNKARTQQIDFVMNESAIAIKRMLTMGIRSNSVFNVDSVTTPASGSYPAMNSEIPAALFKLKEGYYWSAYLRDKTNVNLSDPYLRTIELALQNGRQLRGYVFEHTISQSSTSKVVLFSIKTTYVPSEALI